ncbi:MAG TPA: hypothetical protein VFQ88_13255 [Nevskiaceae bacterium]|nr:hypothetical protein [Nevskiaceae bacterium]
MPISAFIYHSTRPDGAYTAIGATLLLAVTLLLGGCATLTHITGVNDEGTASTQDRLLIYAHRVDALDGEQLAAALHRAQADYAARPDAYNRFQLALVLMVPNRPSSDYSTAQALLSNYLQRPASPGKDLPFAPLAHYLLDSIQAFRSTAQALAKERSAKHALEQKILKITNVVDHAQRTAEAP